LGSYLIVFIVLLKLTSYIVIATLKNMEEKQEVAVEQPQKPAEILKPLAVEYCPSTV
jgi:hypothetical protein